MSRYHLTLLKSAKKEERTLVRSYALRPNSTLSLHQPYKGGSPFKGVVFRHTKKENCREFMTSWVMRNVYSNIDRLPHWFLRIHLSERFHQFPQSIISTHRNKNKLVGWMKEMLGGDTVTVAVSAKEYNLDFYDTPVITKSAISTVALFLRNPNLLTDSLSMIDDATTYDEITDAIVRKMMERVISMYKERFEYRDAYKYYSNDGLTSFPLLHLAMYLFYHKDIHTRFPDADGRMTGPYSLMYYLITGGFNFHEFRDKYIDKKDFLLMKEMCSDINTYARAFV